MTPHTTLPIHPAYSATAACPADFSSVKDGPSSLLLAKRPGEQLKFSPNTTMGKTATSEKHTNNQPAFSPADRIVHNQFSRYGKNAKEWLRKCALLLPEIERRQIWKKRRFSSLYEYAAKLASMSRSSVDEALRVLRRIGDKPALRKVIEEKGIQSVRPVAAIATTETASFWAKKAREMNKNTLEVYVREFKKQYQNKFNGNKNDMRDSVENSTDSAEHNSANAEDNRLQFLPREGFQPENPQKFLTSNHYGSNLPKPTSEIELITMLLEPAVAAELQKLKGNSDWNTLIKELLGLRRQKLEQEKPKPVPTKSRHIPTKIRCYVTNKTRGLCSYPGCVKPYKILHHTDRWALKNIHDPDKLMPLCTQHEQIAHHGLIANEEQPTEKWRILKKPIWWDAKRMVDQAVIKNRGLRHRKREIEQL